MKLLTAIYAFFALSIPAYAGMMPLPMRANIPALDDGGLLVLSTLVGLAAGWVIKRNKKK